MNLPDIGRTPFGFLTRQAADLSAGSLEFNRLLAEMLHDLEASNPHIEIMTVDIFELFDDLLNQAAVDPEGAGFPDADALGFVPSGLSFCINQDAPDPSLADFCGLTSTGWTLDPNDRIFFDLVHPSSRTHSIVADAVEAVKVPEPSTLSMLALGLGLLAVRRRQRVPSQPA